MEKQPLSETILTSVFDLGVFGFFGLVFMGRAISGYAPFLPALYLLAAAFLQQKLLEREMMLKTYIIINIVPGILFVVLFLHCLTGTGLAVWLWGIAGGIILWTRRTALSLTRLKPESIILFFDGSALLLILTRFTAHFVSGRGFGETAVIDIAAMLAAVLTILGERVEKADDRRAPGMAVPVIGGILGLFFLLSAAAMLYGENVSGGIISVVTALAVRVKEIALGTILLIGRILYFLLSLLPEPKSSGKMPEPIPGIDTPPALEEPTQDGSLILLILLVSVILVLLLIALYKMFKNKYGGFGKRIATTSGEKRRPVKTGLLAKLMKRIRSFSRAVFLILFRPDTVPSLIVRAEWFGKRRRKGRKQSETFRAYLSRLSAECGLGNEAALLAELADSWLYAADPEDGSIELRKKIRKSMPVL